MPNQPGRSSRLRAARRGSDAHFETLEQRRAFAVATSAPIADVVMSIGSAAQPIVIRLGDHFNGGGAALDYSVKSTYGYVTTVVDGRGDLTIRASAAVPPGFVTAIDPLVIRATSRTNPNDYRELGFTVFQKAPVRTGNAVLTNDGASPGIGKVTLGNNVPNVPNVVLDVPVALPKPPVTGKVQNFVGDFNGDHADDVGWLDSRNQFWVSPATDGTRFQSVARWGQLPSGQRWQSITVGDFNGDGLSDVAARNSRTGNWHVLISTGTGLAPAVSFGNWSTRVPWKNIVTGDFDGNGTTDLAARNPYTGQWVVSRSRGDRFATTTERGFGAGDWRSISVGDFNGDGRSDLVGRNSGTGAWVVLVSQGSRFAAPARFGKWSTAVAWQDVFLGDFDGDGRADIAGRQQKTGEWVVSRSTGSSFVTTTFGGRAAFAAGRTFVAGDYNFDGKTDILARDPKTGVCQMLASTGSRFAAPVTVGTWPTAAARSSITPLRISYGVAKPAGGPVNISTSGSISSGSSSLISGGSFGVSNTFQPPRQVSFSPAPVTPPPLGFGAGSGNSISWDSPPSGTITATSSLTFVFPSTSTLTPSGTTAIKLDSVPVVPIVSSNLQLTQVLNGIIDQPLALIGSGVGWNGSYSGARSYKVFGTSQGATFGPKGFYVWNLSPADENGTAGKSWDLFRIGGALDLTATAAEPFDLRVSAIPAAADDRFDGSREHLWTIAEAAGGITGFAADKFVIKDATNGAHPGPLAEGQLTLEQVGNTLQLRYTPPAVVSPPA